MSQSCSDSAVVVQSFVCCQDEVLDAESYYVTADVIYLCTWMRSSMLNFQVDAALALAGAGAPDAYAEPDAYDKRSRPLRRVGALLLAAMTAMRVP